jgi:hypothetical protein
MIVAASTGPSGHGKTRAITTVILPWLLAKPRTYHELCPSRFELVIAFDPPTDAYPKGQYGGRPFDSLAQFLRSSDKRRLNSLLVLPTLDLIESVCSVALRQRNTLVIVDEMDMGMPSGGDNRLPTFTDEMVQRGRHKGCAMMGTVRRMGNLHIVARANVQWALFGPIGEAPDVKAACTMMGISQRAYAGFPKLEKFVFVEKSPERKINLTSFKNGQRRVLGAVQTA